MNYKDIIKEIKASKFSSFYLAYGKEFYVLDKIQEEAKKSLNKDLLDFNYDTIDGRNCDFNIIKSKIETVPVMDSHRVVIIKNFDAFKGKGSSLSADEEKEFIDYMKDVPQTSLVIFLSYEDVDGRKKIVKDLSKTGKVVKCQKLGGNDLVIWAKSRFKKYDCEINNSNLIYFLKMHDYENRNSEKNLYDLENEIKKICDYCGSKNEVSKEAIDKLSPQRMEDDIFKFIDSIGNKKPQTAVKILSDMIYEGKAALMILAMISRQIRIMIQAKELLELGYSQNVIAQKLSLHSFVLSKALNQARNFDRKKLIEMLNECSNIDYSIKTGLIKDRLALEMLISKFCR